ncbi:DNA-directed DNA polymerase [Synchytrium endobioticum]|uniref:Probable DNA polymerase n=1 Tax=Synchytrium endobioticum TaxID=286115 RepID=A0A507CDF4_9FUNG|nr:DNA-directed DNA polymerase [Synchytrium endobioticum]
MKGTTTLADFKLLFMAGFIKLQLTYDIKAARAAAAAAAAAAATAKNAASNQADQPPVQSTAGGQNQPPVQSTVEALNQVQPTETLAQEPDLAHNLAPASNSELTPSKDLVLDLCPVKLTANHDNSLSDSNLAVVIPKYKDSPMYKNISSLRLFNINQLISFNNISTQLFFNLPTPFSDYRFVMDDYQLRLIPTDISDQIQFEICSANYTLTITDTKFRDKLTGKVQFKREFGGLIFLYDSDLQFISFESNISCKFISILNENMNKNRIKEADEMLEGQDPISINLLDSLLLLPNSLSKLTKDFKVQNIKTVYPYKFPNPSNLNYIGKVPDIKYFEGINVERYNELFKDVRVWKLRLQTLLYLKNDVLGLHQVLDQFFQEIHTLTGLNATLYISLPSLALAIFRRNYLESSRLIPIIKGKCYDDIKLGYHGGLVSNYIPYVEEAYYYDFKIDNDLGKYFGFVFAEIEAPEESRLKNPILPMKDAIGNLITPRGKWCGWYFSEELKYAITQGYKIKVSHGYHFQRAKIFNKYVEVFYKAKANPQNPTGKIVAKLLLNSLYGKFGMSLDKSQVVIISKEEAELLMKTNNWNDIKELSNGMVLFDYELKPSKE